MYFVSNSCPGGVSFEVLVDTIKRFTIRCEECSKAIMHFCMESCCSECPLFCRNCNSSDHFLHRTNDLKALFLSNQDKFLTERQTVKKLWESIRLFEHERDWALRIIESCRVLINLCDDNLIEKKRSVEEFKKNTWYDDLFSSVERYLTNQITQELARRLFLLRLSRINFRNLEDPIAKGYQQISLARQRIDCHVLQYANIRKQTFLPGVNRFLSDTAIEVPIVYPFFKTSDYHLLKDQHRSALLHQDQIMNNEYFSGKRLIVKRTEKEKVPVLAGDFPLLVELHTQVSFQRFPPVKELGLCLPYPVDLRVFRRIPCSVTKLRVFVEYSNHEVRNEEIDNMVNAIIEVPHFKALSLSVQTLYNLTLDKLIRYAARNQLKELQVFCTQSSTVWRYDFARVIRQKAFGSGTHLKLVKYTHRPIAQVMMIEKTRQIKFLPSIFKEEMLRVCADNATADLLD